jgi:hypothetical protein
MLANLASMNFLRHNKKYRHIYNVLDIVRTNFHIFQIMDE